MKTAQGAYDLTMDAAGTSLSNAETAGPNPAGPPSPPNPVPIRTKGKNQHIQVSPAVLAAARKDNEELLRDLRTSLSGLTQTEAEERVRTTGPNEVAQQRKQGWLIRALKIIRNPLVILLTTLSAISYLTGDVRAGSVMAGMVALSVGLRFWQEARADAAAEKLKAMIHVTATVVRDDAAREIALWDLVPCDIIKLAAGDMIPGDIRLLTSKDVFVSQGSLTGESLPVESSTIPKRKRRVHQPNSRTPVSWGPASRAARRQRSWLQRGQRPTWVLWRARSLASECRRASTRASTASPG